MKRTIITLLLIALATLCLTACRQNSIFSSPPESSVSTSEAESTEASPEAAEQELVLHLDGVPAPSLTNNQYEEELERPLLVLLPPSYYSSEKAYPVVYYLHGYGGSESEIFGYYDTVSAHMESNPGKEFILIGVDGTNKLGGSFYTNSPVIGNWEDYIVNDIVSYVDDNFRTISDKDSRGISGYSMGGYGAVSIALKYPDTFSSLFTIAPGLFADDGLTKAFSGWPRDIKESYAAAFAPNIDKAEPPYFDIPVFDGSKEDNAVVEKWENGYGGLESKINAYISLPTQLKAIHIEYSPQDYYPWIPPACQYFSSLLEENGIANELVEFSGGHIHDSAETTDNFILFFEDNLNL